VNSVRRRTAILRLSFCKQKTGIFSFSFYSEKPIQRTHALAFRGRKLLPSQAGMNLLKGIAASLKVYREN